jgi:hypothetical protein
MSLRRSARIAAQEQKVVQEEEPVIVSKVKRIVIRKSSNVVNNNGETSGEPQVRDLSQTSGNGPLPVKEDNYDFLTLQWIQQFRQELSNINNNPLEASEHLKVLSELIKPFPITYGGLYDWFCDIEYAYVNLNKEPKNNENYKSIRSSIDLCYQELEKLKKKISNKNKPKKNKYPDFVTVEWIQQFRHELSCVSSDIVTSKEHILVLKEMMRNFPYEHGGLGDWFYEFSHWTTTLMNDVREIEKFSFIRSNINYCYQSLEEMENYLSDDEKHDRDYYYPPVVYSEETKQRTRKLDGRIHEFFDLCEKIGIRTFFDIAENEVGMDDLMNEYKIFENYLFSVTEYKEEGHVVRTIYGDLTEGMRKQIMESFGHEYCVWDGESKYKDCVEILIRI